MTQHLYKDIIIKSHCKNPAKIKGNHHTVRIDVHTKAFVKRFVLLPKMRLANVEKPQETKTKLSELKPI